MNRRQRAATRLCIGTRIIARRRAARLAGWVRAGHSHGRRLARLAVIALAGWAAWRMVRGAPWLMWPLAAWWTIAAWRAGTTPAKATGAPDPHAVRQLLADLIGDGRGVHLSAVLQHLQERGHGEGWTVADLRVRLDALGVPVRRSVKVAKRVTWGVHVDDLTAPTPPSADEPAA